MDVTIIVSEHNMEILDGYGTFCGYIRIRDKDKIHAIAKNMVEGDYDIMGYIASVDETWTYSGQGCASGTVKLKVVLYFWGW